MHRIVKKDNIKIILILNILLIFFLCVMFFSFYKIYLWQKDNKENSDLINSIAEYSKEEVISNTILNNEIKIDFDGLYTINKDIVAWIKVNGTNINYPVVKTTNNDFYLNHNFSKKSNSAGAIFMDYRNNLENDRNIVFYGHNRKDGTMFGSLKNCLNKEWCENEKNRTIIVCYPNKNVKYEVFSVYSIENEEYYLDTNFSTSEEFNLFLNKIKERSVYDFNVDLDSTEEIITLSTCGITSKTRVVLHAKK